jgi:hypothetical protein
MITSRLTQCHWSDLPAYGSSAPSMNGAVVAAFQAAMRADDPDSVRMGHIEAPHPPGGCPGDPAHLAPLTVGALWAASSRSRRPLWSWRAPGAGGERGHFPARVSRSQWRRAGRGGLTVGSGARAAIRGSARLRRTTPRHGYAEASVRVAEEPLAENLARGPSQMAAGFRCPASCRCVLRPWPAPYREHNGVAAGWWCATRPGGNGTGSGTQSPAVPDDWEGYRCACASHALCVLWRRQLRLLHVV